MKLMKEHFIPIQIPPHSCDFNSIERVWSVAKSYFEKLLLQHKEEIKTKDDFSKFVLASLS